MQVALTLTPAEMLVRLYRLRWCAVAAAIMIIGVAHGLLSIEFNYGPLLGLSLILAAWNLLVGARLRRGWATTELEGFMHLAIDTLALSALLYWGGGSTSPFVSLYLIPIAIAAAALPSLYAWGITGIAVGAYSALLFTTSPLPQAGHAQHSGFAMHVFGMWVTFIIGGLLLMTFVAGMAAAVRRRDQSLARAREQMLRNEQITAMGALAAGAAHELSTPLSTMAMIVGELRERTAADPELDPDLVTLEQQIELCTQQINHLLGAAEQARGEQASTLPVSRWLQLIIDRWRLMRIVVLTGYASIATTVIAMKRGASGYLAKPVDAHAVAAALGCCVEGESEAIHAERMSLKRLEWEHINRVLAEHEGNVSAAARTLGLYRRTLQRKLDKRPVQD